MRTIRWCSVAIALQAAALFAADARLTFYRTVPPPVDVAPAERLAVIYAIGDSEMVNSFIDWFVEYAGKSGKLRIESAVENNQHLTSMEERALKKLRREHPADAYIGVNLFTCSGTQRSAEGSERDVTGARVRRLHIWVDAVCQARVEIRRPDGRPFVTFTTRGEGTSPRATSLTSQERDVAFQQAARYAALNAAEMITPRVVRETIDLDESAPQFAEGMAMINSERLPDARAIWEAALPLHRDSAALQYDLGAVCEATGDFAAARQHLQSAVRLVPHNRRYREELEILQRRISRK
jgi:hypothetical protein